MWRHQLYFLILLECSLTYREPEIHSLQFYFNVGEKNHKILEKIINKFIDYTHLIFIVFIIFFWLTKNEIKWDAKYSLPKLKPQGRFKTTCIRENESLY